MELNPSLTPQESLLIGLEGIYQEHWFSKLRLALGKSSSRQRLYEILTAASELDNEASSFIVKMREALDRSQSEEFWVWLSRALGELDADHKALNLFRAGIHKEGGQKIEPQRTNAGWLEFIDGPARRQPHLFSTLKRVLHADTDSFCHEALRVFEGYHSPAFAFLQKIRKSQLEKDPDLSCQHLLSGVETFEAWKWVRQLKLALSEYKGFRLDSLSRSQIQSKRWAMTEIHKIFGSHLEIVHIMCGWYGMLGLLMFESNLFPQLKVRSYDVDPQCEQIANRLHHTWVEQNLKFRAFTQDIMSLDYGTTETPGMMCPLPGRKTGRYFREPISLLINTSCEHLADISAWLKMIPEGTPLLLQSNNGFDEAEHVNCVRDLKEFKALAPMSKVFYEGELDCGVFTRFMLIGEK